MDNLVDLIRGVGSTDAASNQRHSRWGRRRQYQIDVDTVLDQRMPKLQALLFCTHHDGYDRADIRA